MPINSFVCQRRSCQKEFDADFDPTSGSPFCPHCGGRPSKWIPRACNLGKVSPGIDRGMDTLVREHNERVGASGGQKITNIHCERDLPAVRAPPPPRGDLTKHVFQTPLGPAEGAIPLNHGRLMGPAFVQAALADIGQTKLTQNKDGRPATPMIALGGAIPTPPPPTPIFTRRT